MGLTACSAPAGPEFTRADGDAIRKQIQDYQTDWNAKDVSKVVGHFAGNAVLMPPNASTVRGHESIKGYYDDRFAAGGSDLQLDVRDLGGYGPVAYVSGTYSSRTAPPDGKMATRDRGKFLWLFRNTNGKWYHEYQIWNSDLPEPMTITSQNVTAKR
jgi:uncharacterized protein (TIGR02246 family)